MAWTVRSKFLQRFKLFSLRSDEVSLQVSCQIFWNPSHRAQKASGPARRSMTRPFPGSYRGTSLIRNCNPL